LLKKLEKSIVLIIDSSPLWAERFISLLQGIDQVENVLEASNYTEALTQLELKPHFVFLDIHLPGKSGIEILKFIKKNYPEMTTCVISNEVNSTVRELCKVLGADEFFDKSNDFNKVPGFIKNNANKKVISKSKPQ
jgi:DNA-binding NarL/FixJ family response regulator